MNQITRHFIVAFTLLTGLLSSAFAADLVYINSKAGSSRLLSSDYNRQYFALASYVDTQERLTFCGISSMAATLNSLPTMARPITPELAPHPFFTEESIFTEATTKIKSRDDVLKGGLTLEQIRQYLVALGANPKIYYGSDLSVNELRKIIKSSLANPHQRVMADFDRKVLNQLGSGHFSPIGAYDSKSDSVLILDVAKFKYPPFWVKTSDLLASLKTTDPDSGKSRGIVQITVN
ncbi:phytochelatin synthase family protein [Polynucleobacter sp. AP-Titi-500A-B4]|uniref:phytochelatin synthase family protein n=1 Tax=Polynucleobacter sp. AP-Titi-500A-B4 TaxID=2576923 RepID=UPI001BFD49D8|nr:phytochelatin synthase family protein [Polynucleobacter sp. AP-Titi-500A-B4]QWE11918.1 phytochelatin synthase family protein [Polynucleobacter sp. AP-Titi-500A-B4]